MRRTVLVLVSALVLFAPFAVAQETVKEYTARVQTMGDKALEAEAKRLGAALQSAVDAHEAAKDAAADGDESTEADVAEKGAVVDDLVARAGVLRAQLEKKGVKLPLEFRKAINAATGEIFADADVALSLLEGWFDSANTWIRENGLQLLLKALLFVLILFAFKLLAKFAGGLTRRAIKGSRLKVSDLLRNFFVNVVSKTIFVFGLLIALETVNVDVGPFLAGIGVIGFVIGFALQGTLANFAAGIMILLYRPYDVGNFVEAGGVKGTVGAMTLVSTTIVTPDNQVHVVPNGSIWGSVITNVTARDTRRVDMVIGVGYGDDLDKVEQVLERVVKAHEKVLADPAPVIKVNALADSSVNFIVRPWAKTTDYWAVYWDLTKAIKQEFDKEGINIPFPQRDVHLYRHDAEGNAA